jgi:hypothetical protein
MSRGLLKQVLQFLFSNSILAEIYQNEPYKNRKQLTETVTVSADEGIYASRAAEIQKERTKGNTWLSTSTNLLTLLMNIF